MLSFVRHVQPLAARTTRLTNLRFGGCGQYTVVDDSEQGFNQLFSDFAVMPLLVCL